MGRKGMSLFLLIASTLTWWSRSLDALFQVRAQYYLPSLSRLGTSMITWSSHREYDSKVTVSANINLYLRRVISRLSRWPTRSFLDAVKLF